MDDTHKLLMCLVDALGFKIEVEYKNVDPTSAGVDKFYNLTKRDSNTVVIEKSYLTTFGNYNVKVGDNVSAMLPNFLVVEDLGDKVKMIKQGD